MILLEPIVVVIIVTVLILVGIGLVERNYRQYRKRYSKAFRAQFRDVLKGTQENPHPSSSLDTRSTRQNRRQS